MDNQVFWDRMAAWRGFASLAVAFGHAVQLFVNFEYSNLRIYSGLLAQASVMIFFVISGYSIAAATQRSFLTQAPVRHYAFNRMARILPPLIFSILFVWVLYLITPVVFFGGSNEFIEQPGLARTGFYLEAGAVLGSLFFLNGFITQTPSANGPLWSLPYEVWLYCIWFLLAWGIQYRRFWAVSSALCLYIILAYFDKTGKSMLFVKYSFVWFGGVVVFYMRNSEWTKKILFSNRTYYLMLILAIACACASIFFAEKAVRAKLILDLSWFNMTIGFLFCTYIYFGCYGYDGYLSRIFQYSSNFSYTLYLIHFPFYLLVFGSFQHRILGAPMAALGLSTFALVVVVLLAWIMATQLEDKESFVLRLQRGLRRQVVSG